MAAAKRERPKFQGAKKKKIVQLPDPEKVAAKDARSVRCATCGSVVDVGG